MDVGVRDQVLYIANSAEPQSLDPHVVTGTVEMRILQNLFEGLVAIDPQLLEPVPAAAESWEVLDDGRRYRFHLRKNLRWSNGDPLTSQDFLYTFRRVLSPKLGNAYIDYFFQNIINALAYNHGEVTDFEKVGFQAPDDATLEVLLDQPSPVLLFYLAQPSFYPVHHGNIEDHGRIDQRGTDWFMPGNLVCNGPFVLDAWKTNTLVTLARNDNYWDRETVRLKEVQFFPIENQESQYLAFQNGQVHVALNLPQQVEARLQKQKPPEHRNHPLLGTYFYVLNTSKPPLTDPRIRRALSLSMDRKALVGQVAQGGQRPAYSYIPLNANKYQPAETLVENATEARRLLAEAGYPEGKGFPALELRYNTSELHRQMAEAVQQMWKANLGIEVRLLNQEWKVFLDALNKGDFDIARYGWSSDPDYLGYLNLLLGDSSLNYTGWNNRQFNQLYREASVLMDPDKRLQTVQRAESLLLDEMPVIPVYFYSRSYLVDTRVKNWFDIPFDTRSLKPVYLEKQ